MLWLQMIHTLYVQFPYIIDKCIIITALARAIFLIILQKGCRLSQTLNCCNVWHWFHILFPLTRIELRATSLFVIAGFKTCLLKNHGNDGSSNKRFIILKKKDEKKNRTILQVKWVQCENQISLLASHKKDTHSPAQELTRGHWKKRHHSIWVTVSPPHPPPKKACSTWFDFEIKY